MNLHILVDISRAKIVVKLGKIPVFYLRIPEINWMTVYTELEVRSPGAHTIVYSSFRPKKP